MTHKTWRKDLLRNIGACFPNVLKAGYQLSPGSSTYLLPQANETGMNGVLEQGAGRDTLAFSGRQGVSKVDVFHDNLQLLMSAYEGKVARWVSETDRSFKSPPILPEDPKATIQGLH